MASEGTCICCDKAAAFTILLVQGPHGRDTERHRFYIPNQHVRKSRPDLAEETPFCGGCIRVVEDNLRATIFYRQAENGLIAEQ